MFTLEKPEQHEAESVTIEALHVAHNYWTHNDNTPLINQLAGQLFGNVTAGDFEQALDHYIAYNTNDDTSLIDLAHHYDEDVDPSLRIIRQDEILQDLTAAINSILTISGHKTTNVRRINQLTEAANDTAKLRWAA